KLQNYNFAYTASGTNPCGNGNTTVQYCANYSVDASNILVNGTAVTGATVAVTNDGNIGYSTISTTSEESTVTLPSQSLGATNTISIGFLLQSTTSTSYVCGGKNGNTATYDACN
ncbi:MAG TPA: hypothetical protein VKA94_04205, partial [Hyphomicrobiales bacterium]|nr:hypothetical protein [Hyphomicrobiales bacterium]